MIVFAITIQMTIRSSHQRCSVRKGVLRNFAKFTGKHLCQAVFFNKVAGPVVIVQKMSSSIPMLLFMFLAHVGKRSNSRSQMFSKTGILKIFAIYTGKNLCLRFFLIKFIIPVHCTLYFRVTFYYYKIRPQNRKNFAIDRSKFVFHLLIFSLLQRLVNSSNCKEKLVALN